MPDNEAYLLVATSRTPWNKGKLIGAKPPLRPKHVWAIRTRLMIERRSRDPRHERQQRSGLSAAQRRRDRCEFRWPVPHLWRIGHAGAGLRGDHLQGPRIGTPRAGGGGRS